MYIKRERIKENNIDKKLENVCFELLSNNEDITFILSKIYEEHEAYDVDITNEVPIIYLNVNPKELYIPSFYTLDKFYFLSLWCDQNDKIAKLEYKDIKFSDGFINDRLVSRLYLKIK